MLLALTVLWASGSCGSVWWVQWSRVCMSAVVFCTLGMLGWGAWPRYPRPCFTCCLKVCCFRYSGSVAFRC